MRAWLCVFLWFCACVSPLEVAGAPCPCPRDFVCCATLSSCVSADTPEACPSSQPASSGAACERDADCEGGEVCHAFRTMAGELAGPRTCRNECRAEAPCGEDEVCELVPHDGASLYEAELTRACVPEAGNEACRCSACDEAQLGRTYCDAEGLAGCFLTFNEACGVACQLVRVSSCPGECETVSEGARCPNLSTDDTTCSKYGCAACANEPGRASCAGSGIVSCARVSYPGDICSELCVVSTQPCPEGSSCVGDEHASCAP